MDSAHPDLVKRGYYHTSTGLHVVDLRAMKPSNALRPHAQHGWLLRCVQAESELWPHIIARVAFPVVKARYWINSQCLDRESLFPPRAWDSLYGALLGRRTREFLANEVKGSHDWGRIFHFDFAP